MNPAPRSLARATGRVLSLVAIAAAGGLVAVAATGAAARSAGAPPPVATKTHLGAAPRDHVVLSLAGTQVPRTFRRVLSDGTSEAAQFVVPKGAALHVTDVEFVGGWNQQVRGPALRVLRLQIVNDKDPAKRAPVAYVSPLASTGPDPGTAIFDISGNRATTGFVVGAGAHLEVDAPELLNAVNGDPMPQPFHGDVVVRGYLVKDR